MDKRIQAMLDHYEITRKVYEYCHARDRMDQVAMADIYSKDSWDDHGPFQMSGQDYAAKSMKLLKDSCKSAQHMIGQTLTNVEGDRAGAETYFTATFLRDDGNGNEVVDQIAGRYVDTFVREEGEWKLQKRLLLRDWSISHPVTKNWLAGHEFLSGRSSNEDPSYAALNMKHSGLPA